MHYKQEWSFFSLAAFYRPTVDCRGILFPLLERGSPIRKKYAPFQSQIPRFAQSREERKSNGLYGRLRKFSIKMVDCCKSFKKGALAASFKGWAGVHWVPKSKAAHRRVRTVSLPPAAFVCGTKFQSIKDPHTLQNPYLEAFFDFVLYVFMLRYCTSRSDLDRKGSWFLFILHWLHLFRSWLIFTSGQGERWFWISPHK